MTAATAEAAPVAAAPQPERVNIARAKGRPMLTWVGKRPLKHVTAFPAQLVEDHDARRIVGTEPADWNNYDYRMQFFSDLRSECNEECWKDAPFIGTRAPEVGGLLLHGDNKDVLAYLLANGFRQSVNLIYIDPPFDSGADYVRKVSLRGQKDKSEIQGAQYGAAEQIQYTDIWANDNYLQFMYERFLLLRELLAEGGTFVLHCDSTKGHHLRCLLDETIGADMFRNEIIWHYENKLGTGGQTFDSRHDTLLVYTKGKTWTHHDILTEVKEAKMQPVTQKIEGKRIWLRDEEGKRIYKESRPERPVGDVWPVPIINPVATERIGFPTQKPEQLLRWVIEASSNPGDLVLDCFLGSGTTAAVAQRLGRRWVGCDINKGAIQTAVKRLRGVITEQIDEARKRAADARQGKLLETSEDGTKPPPKPCAFGFTVWRVNDYDLAIQHNEAVNLACEHIGIERTRTDSFFDGTLGKKLAKIIPFGHPLTPLDLEELRRELDSRPDEDRNITVVCLGMELAARAWLDDWNRLRTGRDTVNKIDVIELRTDPKYGRFIKHEPATARVKVSRAKRGDENRIVVEIQDFISPTILERLREQANLLSPKIDDWRAMVDCIYIDPAYNGSVLNVAHADIPERKSDLVEGKYELAAPADKTTVAVKIIDMLGEEVLVTKTV